MNSVFVFIGVVGVAYLIGYLHGRSSIKKEQDKYFESTENELDYLHGRLQELEESENDE